jgi:hypothetical protein
MKKIAIPKSYNYISAFLTFACTFRCHYCINKYNGLHKYDLMDVNDWVEGLNRIKARADLPITITGGEPTTYRAFYGLIMALDNKLPIDLLTNGDFDIEEFMTCIPADRIKRRAKYASIRFSYHPGYTKVYDLFLKVARLQNIGYSVGIWAVDNGTDAIRDLRKSAIKSGIDFRIKEYLDKTHGTYQYPKALDGKRKKCRCKPSELLIAPDGRLFRCHYDLYHGINSYGHILDKEVNLLDSFLPCDNYGLCNPCDIKTKFDRFQQEGHCAVTIKEPHEKD